MDGRETALRRPSYHTLPSREDCWSEGATSTLIDAWGDRYLDLNRGNLRQKHWQDVADAVNSRDGAGKKPRRTDVQCKNRIDTLKKKYKSEKAKIAAVPDGTLASQWPFFSRLDDLIGPAAALKKPSPPLALPLPYRKTPPSLPQAAAVRPSKDKRPAVAVDDSFFRRNYSAAAAAAAAAVDADSGSSRSSTESRRRVREEDGGGGNGDGDGLHQLAQAIERFAEVYERVEEAKQRQLLELEKERMEFAKGLEFQRMQLFMDWQIQLEKVKRAKRSSAAAGLLISTLDTRKFGFIYLLSISI